MSNDSKALKQKVRLVIWVMPNGVFQRASSGSESFGGHVLRLVVGLVADLRISQSSVVPKRLHCPWADVERLTYYLPHGIDNLYVVIAVAGNDQATRNAKFLAEFFFQLLNS